MMKKSLLLLLAASALSGAELKIVRTPASGECQLNETSVFTIHYSGVTGKSINVTFSGNGMPEKITLPVTGANGSAELKRTMNVPGSLICEAETAGAKKAVSGTIFEAKKIFAISPEPADFASFWQQELSKLNAVKPVAKLELAKDQPKDVRVYDVTIPCVGNAPVKATLGIPEGDRKWPIEVTFHGAGVGSARMLWKAKRLQRILFDINAHGIENLKDSSYYAAQKKRFRNYPCWGVESRDSIYFKNMILRAVQGLRFIKTIPQWDGKNLIVSGVSQGGYQAIAAVALEPGVSCLIACVPAVCDVNADLAGRILSWPRFPDASNFKPTEGRVAVTYIDAVNFAQKIKAPKVLLSAGCRDLTSPPASVCAAYNVMPAPQKELLILPENGHEIPPELEKRREKFFWKSIK
jgi:cephalosporin-C deacetylase-like acetyl esterase